MSATADSTSSGLKNMDVNNYATKKTIAQGLLDIALLTANASQLKYVLQEGEQHDFYTLMLSLIIVSIVLQLIQVIICIFLGGLLNINEKEDHSNATIANNIVLSINAVLVAVNVFIGVFEMKENFLNEEEGIITTEITYLN